MGPDIPDVRRVAEQVAERIRANSKSRIVNFDWNERSKSIQIQIDQDKARQLGLTSEQVAQSLNSALTGRTLTQLRDDIYLIDVIGRAQARDRGDLQSLRDLEINLPDGNSVPLEQIATFRYGLEESIIWRRERLPTITVQATIVPGVQAATVVGELEKPHRLRCAERCRLATASRWAGP